MRKQELIKIYSELRQKLEFKEDKKEMGWMPRLGQNNYRAVIRHGIYKGTPATLFIGSEEFDYFRIVKEDVIPYQEFREKYSVKGCVEFAKILKYGKHDGVRYLLQERQLERERIVADYPFSTVEEKEEVARLYWQTVTNFPPFARESAYTPYRWMSERIIKWSAEGEKNGSIVTFQEKKLCEKILYRFTNELKMTSFFNLFQNTDITKFGDIYYIWNVRITPAPDLWGIVTWLWGCTLHYSTTRRPNTNFWQKQYADWLEKFFLEYVSSNLQHNYRFNSNLVDALFLERIYATHLVDLPNRRSPFDRIDDKTFQRAKRFWINILNEFLSKLD